MLHIRVLCPVYTFVVLAQCAVGCQSAAVDVLLSTLQLCMHGLSLSIPLLALSLSAPTMLTQKARNVVTHHYIHGKLTCSWLVINRLAKPATLF